jgi:hypothetical protein
VKSTHRHQDISFTSRKGVYHDRYQALIHTYSMDKNVPQKENNPIKIQLSLAALMFFSPLVKNMIKKGTISLDPQEKNFI